MNARFNKIYSLIFKNIIHTSQAKNQPSYPQSTELSTFVNKHSFISSFLTNEENELFLVTHYYS